MGIGVRVCSTVVRTIGSRKENKSSPHMPEGPEVFSLGVMRICATALFSM